MKLGLIVGTAMLLGGAGAIAQIAGGSASASYARVDGALAPVTALCDGTGLPALHVLSAPDRLRRATLWTFAKPIAGARTRRVRIGAGDPGAGQIHYPLLAADGRTEIGDLHAFNPGMVELATTPTLVAMTVDGSRTDCRWVPDTRVLAVTPRRTVMVTGTPRSGYRYRSYDFDATLPPVPTDVGHDTRASLSIDGGRLVDVEGQRRVYAFQAGGQAIRVAVSTDPARPGGGVEVRRGGRVLLVEPFEAFTATQKP